MIGKRPLMALALSATTVAALLSVPGDAAHAQSSVLPLAPEVFGTAHELRMWKLGTFDPVTETARAAVKEFNGSVLTCDPGTRTDEELEGVLAKLNLYRQLAGLDPVPLVDPSASARAQEAALIMAANGRLSHYPDESWDCWTEAGAQGARESNLAYGGLYSAVRNFIDDHGPSNRRVGHRRNLLYPHVKAIGVGGSASVAALGTDRSWDGSTASAVAYPPAGHVPVDMLPINNNPFGCCDQSRWSLSFHDLPETVDLQDAVVTVRAADGALKVTQHTDLPDDTPDPQDYAHTPPAPGGTLSWDVSKEDLLALGVWEPSPDATTVTVSISGIKYAGEAVTYAYDVHLTPERFADDDGSVFEADIQALAAAGITRGCNPPANDRFCPDENVTRGQMAAFLGRALGLSASSSDTFEDDDGSVFEADIQALAAAGITRGCNPPANDRFCPDENVTRGQMAAFLVRAGLAE